MFLIPITIAAENQVYLDPDRTSAVYPNTVDIEIRVDATDFRDGQIELSYDSSCCDIIDFSRNTAVFPDGFWKSLKDGRDYISIDRDIDCSGFIDMDDVYFARNYFYLECGMFLDYENLYSYIIRR